MPTLLDDDDDDEVCSEFSYDIRGAHSPSDDHHRDDVSYSVSESSQEYCTQGRVTILHVRRKSSGGSSGLGASTPPSPLSDPTPPSSELTSTSMNQTQVRLCK